MTRPELRTETAVERSGTIRASLLDVGRTRISDAVLMGLFMVVMLVPGTPVGVHTVASAVLVGIAAFRRPVRSFDGAHWYLGICAAILVYLTITSYLSGVTSADVNRLIRISLLMLLAGFIASGRIDARSGLRGIAIALAVNVPLFYAGVTPDNYGGVLTGLLGDKNVAGLSYAIFTLLLLVLTRRVWLQVVVILGGGACVFLTDSRTSIAALAAGVLWLVVARYLNPFFKVCLGVLIYFLFEFAEENFAQAGAYVAREGSDALRERIDAASLEKVTSAPWFGAGLGEATVEVAGDPWFFHNAYWGLLVEGGYPLLIGILAVVGLAGMQFLGKGPATRESRIVEAATIALLLCSFRLGETFFSIPGFMVIGVGLLVYLQRHAAWRAALPPAWSAGIVALPDENRPVRRTSSAS